MNVEFLEKLEWARILSDYPYSISSAIRCYKHNIDVGGLATSSHLTGRAVDIRTPNARARYKILYGLIKAGFKRIGIYKSFIHVDGDETKPPEVCWFDHDDVEVANQTIGE